MSETLQAVQGPQAAAITLDDFESLIQKEFKPKSERANHEVQSAVRTLAGEALKMLTEEAVKSANISRDDTLALISHIIGEIDKKLSEQINLILHHPEMQQLEGAWRGLHHLVSNTESGAQMQIKVLNISKKELGKTLKRYKGSAWDQSPLFKRFYEEEYGQLGGEPYGCFVGDYHFDHSPQDVELLAGMSQICAAAHAPFISAAAPSLLQMESWREIANPRDIAKIFTTPDYAAWRSLRDSDDSRYISLTMPRFLARLPYGAKTNPVDEFAFEEDTAAGDAGKYTWANSAYAMATNITRAFSAYGWCTRIRGVESGGSVEGLPVHTFPTDDGGVDMKCPTEVAISDRREAELSSSGLLPLIHRKNSDVAAFLGAQTLHKPTEYDSAEATANAALSARLPYLFASCRFAHYLKCIVRDKIGGFSTRESMQRWLQDWILNYVDGNPEFSTDDVKARRPLAGAEVEVTEIEGQPGYYSAKFSLKPHYQLEGMSVSLRLVSRLPSQRGQ